MSRSIDALHPELQLRYHKFSARAALAEIDFVVTCTWRSFDEQARLYAQGRTLPGRIVTNAKPGESNHNYVLGANGKPASLAFDIVPLRDGKPVWGTAGNGIDADPTDDDTDDLELWQIFGQIGKECGLAWAGEWKRFREFPHFELVNADQIRRGVT